MSTHAIRDPKPYQSRSKIPSASLFRLQARTILITGGGGAVGLHAARTCIELGADVLCLDRMPSPLSNLWDLATTAAATHNKILKYVQLDISSHETVESTITSACADFPCPVRGLVCCAAISDGGPALDFSLDRFKAQFDTNVTGTFACIQAVARIMQRQYTADTSFPGGSIVVIASMSGHGSNLGVDTAAYNSSKAALHQLVRSLAAEWGCRPGVPLIRVNSVSPGYIRTRMTEDTLKEEGMQELWEHGNMLGRLSEADEYRGIITFLLGEASSFITGSDVRVDGGHTAW